MEEITQLTTDQKIELLKVAAQLYSAIPKWGVDEEQELKRCYNLAANVLFQKA